MVVVPGSATYLRTDTERKVHRVSKGVGKFSHERRVDEAIIINSR